MSLYEKLPSDICYICQKAGNNLVSPCGNVLHENIPCEIKTHRECLENITVCPKCSNPIIINKVKKFNLYNFTKNHINRYTIYVNLYQRYVPSWYKYDGIIYRWS
jgi:hypothetical protein